jgi:spermidine/putrescine transport system substrate-binding protein
LVILDYAGDDDPHLWQPYADKFSGVKPSWSYITSDDNLTAKLTAGAHADIAVPCSGFVKTDVSLDVLQPWDTSLIPNFATFDPGFKKIGVINGAQYYIPNSWGFSSVLYRTDMVTPTEQSLNLLFDERYAGKITWFDGLDLLAVAAMALNIPDPWAMTDQQLNTVTDFLVSKKHLIRHLWTSETDLQTDFANGNVWIAFAWPSDYVAMKAKGLSVVYMQPKEGREVWHCGFALLKDTQNYYHAHEYVNAWVSPTSAEWLLNNFAFGTPNTSIDFSKVDPSLVSAFGLNDPNALKPPLARFALPYARPKAYGDAYLRFKAS